MNRKRIIMITIFAIIFNLCTFSVIKAEDKDKDKDKDKKINYNYEYKKLSFFVLQSLYII